MEAERSQVFGQAAIILEPLTLRATSNFTRISITVASSVYRYSRGSRADPSVKLMSGV
jgi:hypothetical protein